MRNKERGERVPPFPQLVKFWKRLSFEEKLGGE